MSATQQPEPAADFTAISLKRLHSSEFWSDMPEWLPRRAQYEIQIGPTLGFSRIWRELHIELCSGPEYLYRYFPFTCFVYVDDRAAVVLEFDAPSQSRTASVRVPIGVPFRVTVLNELAHAPSSSGHGTDTRALALQCLSVEVGDIVARPVKAASAVADGGLEQLSLTSEAGDSPAPAFVVGAYRSGTSVLTWALGQHPNIWPMEETGWLAPIADGVLMGYRNAATAARSFFDVYDVEKPEYMTQMGRAVDEFCRRISRRLLHGILLGRLSGKDEDYTNELQLARSVMNPKQRWVDGTPEHCGYVMVLRELFPRARFIGLVRDPLDVVASMLRFDRAGGRSREIRAAADMWLQMTRMTVLSYRVFGPTVMRLISNARLIENPAATLSELFEFLDEPNFPNAVQAFSKRINSSNIDDEERAALHAQIDAEPDIKAELLNVYREAIAVMGRPWAPDVQAEQELSDMLNDRISRMAREYTGGPSTSTA